MALGVARAARVPPPASSSESLPSDRSAKAIDHLPLVPPRMRTPGRPNNIERRSASASPCWGLGKRRAGPHNPRASLRAEVTADSCLAPMTVPVATITCDMDARTYYEAVQDRLVSEFATAEGLAHRGLRGSRREDAVRGVLRAALPTSVGVSAGEIASTAGNRSPEIDILLHDALGGAALYRYEQKTVFPPESVLAVVSVKSRLQLGHLDELVALAASLRNFDAFPRHMARRAGDDLPARAEWPADADAPPGVFVIAATGPRLESVLDRLRRLGSPAQHAHPEDHRLNGVAILNRGYVSHETRPPDQAAQLVPFVRTQEHLTLTAIPLPRDTLGLFVMALNYFCAYQPRVFPNITRFMNIGGADRPYLPHPYE